MKTQYRKPKAKLAAGFSLIEVTISIGVASMALIPLIALLPGGASTLHSGNRAATEAEIVRAISGELSMSDWSRTNDLADWHDHVRFYDREANELNDDQFTAYTVKIAGGNDIVFPGTSEVNPYLKTIDVLITSLPDTVATRFNDTKQFRRYSIPIVKMDQ